MRGRWKANLIQAGLFGLWPIALPIRDYLDGQMDGLTIRKLRHVTQGESRTP